MATMTNSQFATFRADVQRAARDEIQAQMNSIRNEIFHGLRQHAIATAREAATGNVTNLSNRVQNLEDLVGSLNVRIAVLENQLKPTVSLKLDVNGRISGVEAIGGTYSTPAPKNGDEKWETLPGGQTEKFVWWWGQWRRKSELEGFATWLARRATR